MTERYRTGEPNPPWDDPTSTKSWQVWQEPWFRARHPIHYRINVWL